jgi:hypothetical protein
MFKSQRYRAKAVKYRGLVQRSVDPDEIGRLQELEGRLTSLADNEEILAYDYDNAVAEQDGSSGAALAAEEELVLRCLGAAIIMQWNALPKTLRREIFDTAGSVGKLLETAALRGRIARFLHKHKDDAGCRNESLTEDVPSGSKPGALALARWENEGGAVRDGLPTAL